MVATIMFRQEIAKCNGNHIWMGGENGHKALVVYHPTPEDDLLKVPHMHIKGTLIFNKKNIIVSK